MNSCCSRLFKVVLFIVCISSKSISANPFALKDRGESVFEMVSFQEAIPVQEEPQVQPDQGAHRACVSFVLSSVFFDRNPRRELVGVSPFELFMLLCNNLNLILESLGLLEAIKHLEEVNRFFVNDVEAMHLARNQKGAFHNTILFIRDKELLEDSWKTLSEDRKKELLEKYWQESSEGMRSNLEMTSRYLLSIDLLRKKEAKKSCRNICEAVFMYPIKSLYGLIAGCFGDN
jgi:hypothetical protein